MSGIVNKVKDVISGGHKGNIDFSPFTIIPPSQGHRNLDSLQKTQIALIPSLMAIPCLARTPEF